MQIQDQDREQGSEREDQDGMATGTVGDRKRGGSRKDANVTPRRFPHDDLHPHTLNIFFFSFLFFLFFFLSLRREAVQPVELFDAPTEKVEASPGVPRFLRQVRAQSAR